MKRSAFHEHWPLLFAALGGATITTVGPVISDDLSILRAEPWAAWQLTLDVSVPLLLVGALYAAGVLRGRARAGAAARHGAFAGGLLAIFIALQSPVESLADHLLALHEVEHMLLRTIGPMLLVLAGPQATLLRGLPDWLRHRVVAPGLSARAVQSSFGALTHPAVATTLFIAASAFWYLPRYHDLALANEWVHWLMHVGLLTTGLLFLVRLLDPRHPALGPSLSTRLLMCGLAIISNILIGFAVTFSPDVLYPEYQASGLLWDINPRLNQIYGGQTAWIPGSMMLGIALLTTVYRWGRHEERDASRHLPTERAAISGVAFVLAQRPRNRALALGLIGFALTVLAFTLGSVIAYEGSLHNGHPASQQAHR
ncbi:MAG: cytochrome c oxidase assembly protein [Rhodospirillales bacterium]|nr:cytochrome c oxidase assembly protein [Rhodospirillales bacterium]